MKPIIEYSDFRQYMLEYYEERKRRSVFSWREFSKIAGFSSSSYMKVVCDGKSKLSRVGVERTGAAMGLVGFEMEYFRQAYNRWFLRRTALRSRHRHTDRASHRAPAPLHAMHNRWNWPTRASDFPYRQMSCHFFRNSYSAPGRRAPSACQAPMCRQSGKLPHPKRKS